MAEHSKYYDKVKRYYDLSFWSDERVRNAVTKEWITASEYKEITGKDF